MKNLSLILCALLLLVSITGCNIASALAPEAPVNGTEGETEGTESAATESETVEPESETITTETETEPEEETEEVEIVHVIRDKEDYESFKGEDGKSYIRYKGGEYEIFEGDRGYRCFFTDSGYERYTGEDGKEYVIVGEKHFEVFADEKLKFEGLNGEYYVDKSRPKFNTSVFLGVKYELLYEDVPLDGEELTEPIEQMFCRAYLPHNYRDFDSYERYIAADGTEYISYEGKDYKVFTSKDGGKYFLTPNSYLDGKIICRDKNGNRYVYTYNMQDLVNREEKLVFKDGVGYYDFEFPEDSLLYDQKYLESLKYSDSNAVPEGVEEGKSYFILGDVFYEIEEEFATGKSYRISDGALRQLHYDETKEALGYAYTTGLLFGSRQYLSTYHPLSGGDIVFGSEEMYRRLGIGGSKPILDITRFPEVYAEDVLKEVLNVIKEYVSPDVRVSIDSNGKVLSNVDYHLPQEAIEKIANIYFGALRKGGTLDKAYLCSTDYHEDLHNLWVCYYAAPGVKGQIHLNLIVRSNGELLHLSQ